MIPNIIPNMNPNVRDGVRDYVKDSVRVQRLLQYRKPFVQGTFRDSNVRVRAEIAFFRVPLIVEKVRLICQAGVH